ncbi:hypothetical protein [Microbacterium sp. KCTC 39802]|uniref:CBU_0592 family membrane protein n=1 Tax=Microbacterium TaxID=33882 RepID=UPI0013A5BBC2|nr:hypothetical protein [Microbacterium sp. KCTC 39802]
MIEIIGWIGTTIVLAAYFALSLGWMQPGIGFQLANVAGSCALLINGAHHGAMPSVAVNGAWLAISTFAIFRLIRIRSRTALSYHSAPKRYTVRQFPFDLRRRARRRGTTDGTLR